MPASPYKSHYSDVEPWEVLSALIIAICIQVGSGTVLYLFTGDRCPADKKPSCPAGTLPKCSATGWECKPSCDAPAPPCAPGEEPVCDADFWVCKEEVVAVKPVIDEEAFEKARLGGKKAKLPEMWDRAPESVKKKIQETTKTEDTTEASTQIGSDEIPDAGHVATLDAQGTSEDAEGTEQTDAEPQEGPDAGQAEGSEDAEVATLDKDGGSSNATNSGCQGPGCEKDGKNPDFIAAQYAGRLQAFFKRGFVVSGLGLPEDEIKRLAASVSVTLSGDGTVTGFSMGSSGNPTFDAAARAQIQSKVGSQVPPPPEDRPELKKSALSLTLTCGSGCN